MESSAFANWFTTFNQEKGISSEAHVFQVEGESGMNVIPLEVVFEHILITSAQEQSEIKKVLVKLDFNNAPIIPFYEHLAKALAQ